MARSKAAAPPEPAQPDTASDDSPAPTVSDELDSLRQSLDPKALAAERAAQLAIIQAILASSTLPSKSPLRDSPTASVIPSPAKKRKVVTLPLDGAKDQSGWKPVERYDPSSASGGKQAVNVGSLKDMFKPQEQQGASIAGLSIALRAL
jgi:hypothetical protein